MKRFNMNPMRPKGVQECSQHPSFPETAQGSSKAFPAEKDPKGERKGSPITWIEEEWSPQIDRMVYKMESETAQGSSKLPFCVRFEQVSGKKLRRTSLEEPF